jgi:ABC-2 type transport system ATP-binding protein
LIVIGRGRLIADIGVDEFVHKASGTVVHVRSPQPDRLRELLTGPEVTIDELAGGLLEIKGVTAERIGEVAAANQVVLHELSPQQASLEEAFMELTREDVEFRGAAHEGGELAA